MNRTIVVPAGCLLGALVLAGCGGPSATPASAPAAAAPSASSGPRNPCALLTGAQLRALQQNAGQSHPDVAALDRISCAWTNFPVAADTEYVARLLPRVPPGATPTAPVAGLPTAEYVPPNADRRTHCVLLVTLDPRTTLWAQYGNISGDIPGMTHEMACAGARVAATDMVHTAG